MIIINLDYKCNFFTSNNCFFKKIYIIQIQSKVEMEVLLKKIKKSVVKEANKRGFSYFG
jgi:hypothetical protein